MAFSSSLTLSCCLLAGYKEEYICPQTALIMPAICSSKPCSWFLAACRFDALPDLPCPSSLSTWGNGALVSSYASALPLAQAALPDMRAALEYYQLDGWVTEHVNILFEMSNLYR